VRGVAGRVVRRSLLATVFLAVLLAGLGGLLSGSAAATGVLVGAALVCGFFGLGALVLIWVTRVSPAATLLVGLMTYTLQVVLLAIAFAALRGSGLIGSTIDGAWLGGTVIAGTVVWLAIQVTLSMRARSPYFDLPSEQGPSEGSAPGSERRSAGGPEATEAGAR
jgi:ATP synthase protein I